MTKKDILENQLDRLRQTLENLTNGENHYRKLKGDVMKEILLTRRMLHRRAMKAE